MPVEIASDDAGGPDPQPKGPGTLLREGRLDVGLTLEQVADGLHLDERVIAALEAEEFADIGAPVFVRGHLKAYARVLRIDESKVLDAYRASLPDEPTEPVLSRRPSRQAVPVSLGPVAMGAIGLLVIAALAVYVLVGEDPATDTPPVPTVANEGPAPAEAVAKEILPPPVATQPIAEVPAADSEPVDPVPEAAPEVEAEAEPKVLADAGSGAGSAILPEPESAPEAPPADVLAGDNVVTASAVVEADGSEGPAPLELELYFREESWVEISDADQRILFGLQREGMRRQLAGVPPIQFLFGNAPGVDVYLGGELYAIPARNINGKVARFTIDSAAEIPQ
jgi:cytoskeleton protein RodZ